MTPSSPVFLRSPEQEETVFAKDQPQYRPLPAFRDSAGIVVSRWQLSWKERFTVLFGGNIWLQIHTFNSPLQPSNLTVKEPELQ